jgi:hypothetical protein
VGSKVLSSGVLSWETVERDLTQRRNGSRLDQDSVFVASLRRCVKT